MSKLLIGVEFKCHKGHVWESAVGTIWLQMPTCPECGRGACSPATSWKGKWLDIEIKEKDLNQWIEEWNLNKKITYRLTDIENNKRGRFVELRVLVSDLEGHHAIVRASGGKNEPWRNVCERANEKAMKLLEEQ